VLGVFCSAAFWQGMVWAIPGPISAVLSEEFNCGNSCDALLVNWGPIAFLVAALPSAWLIDHSLRWATISLAMLVTASGWARVASTFVTDSTTVVVLLHVGQALNALGEHCMQPNQDAPLSSRIIKQVKHAGAMFVSLSVCVCVCVRVLFAGGPVAMGAVARLSQIWFPAHERSLSTALAAELNMAGVAVSFLLGPLIVPKANLGDIATLWWVLAIPPTVILAIALLFLADAPESPPSMSAHKQRQSRSAKSTAGTWSSSPVLTAQPDSIYGAEVSGSLQWGDDEDGSYGAGGSGVVEGGAGTFGAQLWALLRNADFVVLAAGYAFSAGVYSGWGPLLSINLRSSHVDATEAGWIGFCATMAGVVGGVVMSIVHGYTRRVKPMLVALMFIATASFTVFAVACQPDGNGSTLLPTSTATLFATATVGGFCVNAMIPLMYEGSVEAVFGEVDEGLVGSILAAANNVCCLAFLAVPIQGNSTSWMNWTMAGAVAVFVVVFALWRERTRRLNIDDADNAKPLMIDEDALKI
jgi:FLVCR family MFS transporter